MVNILKKFLELFTRFYYKDGLIYKSSNIKFNNLINKTYCCTFWKRNDGIIEIIYENYNS